MPDRIEPNADVRGNWTKINDSLDKHSLANRRATQLAQLANWKRKGRGNTSEGLYPFKLYLALPHQIPTVDTGTDPDPDEAWRTFLVRAGRIEDKALEGDGCDNYDDDPDSDYYPTGVEGTDDQTQQITPIVIPADSEAYWFWVEIVYDNTSSTTGKWKPVLRHGDDPTNNDDAENDWETFPKADGLHLPIGYVDTKTTPGIAIVRQLMRADIIAAYTVNACDEQNNPIKLHIPAAFKEPDPPDDP
jgi:hypothetical protein